MFRFLSKTSFSARMVFIRAENEVGARSAQCVQWRAGGVRQV